MEHERHAELIKTLETKVRVQVPPGTHPWPHIQACWKLINQIGPGFKRTNYRDRKSREYAWACFQGAVTDLKNMQSRCEQRSAETKAKLFELIMKAWPSSELKRPAVIMPAADALDPAELARQEEASVQTFTRLQTCADAHKDALNTFMILKWQLTPAHFKAVSDMLRNAKQELEQAQKHFREGSPERFEQAKRVVVQRRNTGLKAKYLEQLEAETVLLDHKKGVLRSHEKTLFEIKDEAIRAQTQRWRDECVADIAVLEASIAGIQAKITGLAEPSA